MPSGNLRLLLADDHAVVREGLKTLIELEPGMEVVGEAEDGEAACRLAAACRPDVVVIDVSMPRLNGARATERMKQMNPEIKVLALTVHEDKGYLRELLQAGASGYVLKRAVSDELIYAIRTVASGGIYLDPTLAEKVVGSFLGTPGKPPSSEGHQLSERESSVLRLLAQGYSNKEISAQLSISVKTVETYKVRSMEKLGLDSRVDVVRYASERGWLQSF
jgi:DNA-binding NarL/FixJ family response regulator